MDKLETLIDRLLTDAGISEATAPSIRLFILLMILAIVASISFWITKQLIVNALYRVFRKTSFKWDDVLVDHKVLNNVAHIVPAAIVRIFTPMLFRDFEYLIPLVIKLTDSYLIIVGTLIVLSFLRVAETVLSKSTLFADKPIASYFQLIRIVFYIAAGILVLSVLLGKSPLYFLSAFGAMTAIILLIFKDTILGLVASVQISSNDMVRVGDWVEMPKFNADGDVVAINLNTVKVQNWDKTVTTIPTYFFITDSFKNWRGMQESGGRRIKRSIHLNVHSISFVAPETREEFKKIFLIRDFVTQRQREIEDDNAAHDFDTTVMINGRRMTNIGVFRHYAEAYLKHHKRIRKNMTLLVRQLPLDSRGVPIEIYCFTNTTAWLEFEEIQSDIFDHLMSAVSYFGLEIYQQPSGTDITAGMRALAR